MKTTAILFASAFLLTSAVFAADAPQEKIAPDLEQKIHALIKQLGDADWNKREAATTELQFIGKPAVPYLTEARQKSEDPEVRSRCETILNFINPPAAPAAPADPPGVFRLGGGGMVLQIGGAPAANVVQTTIVTKTFAADGKNYVVTDTTENQTRSITVEITEKVDGKEVRKIVKAADEKELEKKEPALFKIIKDNEPNAMVQRRMQAVAQMQIGFGAPVAPATPPPDPTSLDLLATYGMKLRLTDDGVVVSDIKANSAADKADLRMGDVIKQINKAAVSAIDDARKAFADTAPEKPLELEVTRAGKPLNIKFTPETK
jgi:membrane-associated protease RseP (regulator of RpoE activity)